MKIWTAIFSALIISLTGHAKEGFDLNPPGHNLDTAWNATFALTSENSLQNTFVTSSVLAYKTVNGPFAYLGFLSSGHSMTRLLEQATTQKIRVSRNIHMIDQLELVDTIPGQIMDNYVIDMSYDLSLFVVRISAKQAGDYVPVAFAPNCPQHNGSSVFLFGFPGTFLRDVSHQREKISAPNLLIKRSSNGLVTDQHQFGPDQTELCAPLVGTTADSLGGDSGGPVVDIDGRLTGILISSLASNENDYAYQGFEGLQMLRAHSFATGCRVTQQFANFSWRQFLGTLDIKSNGN